MEIDARGSEKSLSFCYLKIDNIFCVSRLTREGSGTTLRASYELERTSYGFEIDKNFYQRAKNEMLRGIYTNE